MSSAPYSEFEWHSAGSTDGESGATLAQSIIKQVTKLENVKSICDLGCGNGYLAGHLAALGYDVVGVDASPRGIRIATQTYPHSRFVCALINETLRSRTALGAFDLVISSDAIEHFYRPADLVSAAVSLLKADGHLLLGTPYHGYLKNLALSLVGKMDAHFDALEDGGHIKFFSVKTLSQLLESYGFINFSFSFYGRAPWLWKNMICHARAGRARA
jgi:2-polyprenyl-3-methyl-5-hydroxy-6-metoxy-1,4-benzoquinol methylase